MNKKVKVYVMNSSGQPLSKIPKEIEEEITKIVNDLTGFSEEGGVAPEMTIPYYEAKIAERNRVSPELINDILSSLWAIQPGCVISILLRAIAMEMDLNYPDHISQAKEWWVVNIATGQISGPVSPQEGVNFRNIALFRCIDDAKGACIILKPLFKSLYGGKQKNNRSN